jgi:NADH pyrophosphatase NudC (nudix superfamily)
MFKYCPACRSESISFDGLKLYECSKCGWSFYHNACSAVMAVLTLNNKILFTYRANDPAKDKLDLPGGFVDPGETAEEAVAREIDEELNLKNLNYIYIGSAVNSYRFNNINYPTCDLIYHAEISEIPGRIQKSEIKDVVLLGLTEIKEDDIAFPSVKKAVELWAKINRIDISKKYK